MLVALTLEVSPAIAQCELTHLPRLPIDYGLAHKQHQQYEQCLVELGCHVIRAPAAPDLPDAVFVEDTCIVLDELAIITCPGAESRRPETVAIAKMLQAYRPLRFIKPPATMDGGDIFRLDRQLYVGQTRRTNLAAIDQLRKILRPLDYTVIAVPVTKCLHLKSAVSSIGARRVLLNPSWIDPGLFANAEIIEVDSSEPRAANVLLIEKSVICPAEFPATRQRLECQGTRVISIDYSELAKAEAGLTCCSVIFERDAAPHGRAL